MQNHGEVSSFMLEAETKMENKGLINSEDIQIQGLLDRYLRLRVSSNVLSSEEQHLDEDLVTAFVEGNLQEREAQPIVKHLVDCSFCRHVTAELVKLDFALADEEVMQVAVDDKKPSRVSEVLNGLLSRIFGTTDGAVFAHHEKEEDTEKTENTEEDKQ